MPMKHQIPLPDQVKRSEQGGVPINAPRLLTAATEPVIGCSAPPEVDPAHRWAHRLDMSAADNDGGWIPAPRRLMEGGERSIQQLERHNLETRGGDPSAVS
jgi:hypothetical protein